MIYTLVKKSSNGKKFELEDKSGNSEWYTMSDTALKYNKWIKEGCKVEANVQDGEITYLKNLDAKGKGNWGGKTSGGNGAGFNPTGLRQTALNGAVQVTASLIAVKAVEEDAVLDKIKDLFNEFLTIVEGKKASSNADDKKEDADDEEETPRKKTKKVEFTKGDAVDIDSDDFSGTATIVSVDEDEETLMVKDKKGKKYEVKFSETTLQDEE